MSLLLALTSVLLAAVNTDAAQPGSHPRFTKAAKQPAKRGLANPFAGSGGSQRKQIVDSLPMHRLTPQAQRQILDIAKNPTIYRRLPTQAIACDQEMFLLITRKPETLVGIWDLMGITKVQCRRVGPYKIEAVDGAGTTCKIDLIYGDNNLHIFVAEGSYDGSLAPRPIRGRGVIVLRSNYAQAAPGHTTVTGTIDCFVKFDNVGADLVARTLSGVIGRSADNNFIETARFVAQVNQAAKKNPPAMIDVAKRLPQVDLPTRKQFADVVQKIAQRHYQLMATSPRQTPRKAAERSFAPSHQTATIPNPMRQ